MRFYSHLSDDERDQIAILRAAVANSTASRLRHGPRRWTTSAL